ncbi:Mannosyl-oligosaccharide alpha-1,2-mannosidase and related glycosyl hydrolases [Ceraceosorus bombacis]|uniref:alpha-1,2-Mannosidase n=1 Tax=Ceraceosorus bombacis TaxID=401625 RepID=A0A0P1BPZ3_9BASI|nr:Mannosyl-oligosaccharide alpha-1,2-mannosidase and related glycosyl hydrolases [Ceraceosorus bombacis]
MLTARQSYLPVPGSATPGASNLLSRLIPRRRSLLCTIILVFFFANVFLWGPDFAGEERMQRWGVDHWSDSMRPWLGHKPPPGSGKEVGFPSDPVEDGSPAPVSPLVVDDLGGLPPSAESDKLYLESSAFPPQLASTFTATEYPAGSNPHRGEIPAHLLSVLEARSKAERKRPPHPGQAPWEPTGDVWNTWNRPDNGSRSTRADAMHPAQQGLDVDWRVGPFAGWRPPLAELSSFLDSKLGIKPLPRVQHAFQAPHRHSGVDNDEARETLIAERQKLVKAAFLHAWEGYKTYAWGHDELKPVSKKPNDNFNGWGATIVDALGTLLIMDLPEEYDLARQHVRDIDFGLVGGSRSAYGSSDGRVPVFETSIRYLGGLLSAYDLSGDELMLDRAEELAQLLSPAFETHSGVPIGRLRFGEPPSHSAGSSAILAEAGSMLLEYTRLWQVTGNRTYFDKVQRTTDWLDRNMTKGADRLGSLLPTTLFPESKNSYGSYSFGGMADSYYEYLIKEHQLLGGALQYGRMYAETIDDARKHLMRSIGAVPAASSLLTIGISNGHSYTPKLEHLACFSGGMLGLGSRLLGRERDLANGRRFTETCWWSYNATATGIGPEELVFYSDSDPDRFEFIWEKDGTSRRGKPRGSPMVGVRHMSTDYRNRPEVIESVLYMWRITGDPIWQERGWQMFSSWVTHCMTDAGFSSIYNVNAVPTQKTDSMESFMFAEVAKYYYLLFSPPDLISLDDYVFTTEAHPLLLPKRGSWGVPGNGPRKHWDPAAAHVPTKESGLYSGGEGGHVGGLTFNQKTIIAENFLGRALDSGSDAATAIGAAIRKYLSSTVNSAISAAPGLSGTTTEQPPSGYGHVKPIGKEGSAMLALLEGEEGNVERWATLHGSSQAHNPAKILIPSPSLRLHEPQLVVDDDGAQIIQAAEQKAHHEPHVDKHGFPWGHPGAKTSAEAVRFAELIASERTQRANLVSAIRSLQRLSRTAAHKEEIVQPIPEVDDHAQCKVGEQPSADEQEQWVIVDQYGDPLLEVDLSEASRDKHPSAPTGEVASPLHEVAERDPITSKSSE